MPIADMLASNKKLAKTYVPQQSIMDIRSGDGVKPTTLIITCADPRCSTDRFFESPRMDNFTFRSICGHVAPHLPEIVGVDTNVNFEEVMIIHHTDCGALYFDEAEFRRILVARAPDHTDEIDKLNFGTIKDVKQSILDDMEVFKASALVRPALKDAIRGFIFNIETGMLEEVFPY